MATAGAALAVRLHRGVADSLLLVDPYPSEEEGPIREVVVAAALRGDGEEAAVLTSGASALDLEVVRDIANDVDLLVCAFDPELRVVSHWVNQAALLAGIPALFVASHRERALAGPLVVPGETACYQCWRLRRLACADDVRSALAREERHTARRRPEGPGSTDASLAAWLATWLAEIASDEIERWSADPHANRLAGRVLVCERGEVTTPPYRVLTHPECPACGGKVADGPAREERGILALGEYAGPICGWVRRLARVEMEPDVPPTPVVFEAELANHRFVPPAGTPLPLCFGSGWTENEARRSALGEAAERYAAIRPNSLEVVRSQRGDLPGPSLDPRRLVLFAPPQYETLPYAPYDESSVIGWVEARAWCAKTEVYVPALGVLLTHEVAPGEAFLFPTSTNGLAAGRDLESAILAALFEVVERDAFLHLWLHRLPADRVDPLGHPDDAVRELCREQAQRGVSLELYKMPTDSPVHAFLALGVASDTDPIPAFVVGLGANLDPARAARSALLESTMSRPNLRQSLRNPLLRAQAEGLQANVHQVTHVADHCLRYALPAAAESFSFLRDRPVVPIDWSPPAEVPPEDAGGRLDLLSAHLAQQDRDLLYCDLTPADVARFGLRVVRVLVPEFQPMHFGRHQRRLGGSRLFTLPRELGFRTTDATPAELNDEPHPLA